MGSCRVWSKRNAKEVECGSGGAHGRASGGKAIMKSVYKWGGRCVWKWTTIV